MSRDSTATQFANGISVDNLKARLMEIEAGTPPRPTRAASLASLKVICAAIRNAAGWADRERRHKQAIARLEALDPRTLSDIGLSWADIQCGAQRSPTKTRAR